MAGAYPAVASPQMNLPTNIVPIFLDVAIRIQPMRSGSVINKIDFLRPNLEDRKADRKPPRMAPRPKMEARKHFYVSNL
jgi:hypothetical protein